MSEDNHSNPINQQSSVNNFNKISYKKSPDWGVKIISGIVGSYLLFSLLSPMLVKSGQNLPRKIENSDIALIFIILIFNSDLLNRLENFGISKDGNVTAKFNKLEREIEENKKEIDALQSQQLEQLEKQQKTLADMQAFMYNFLLAEKDIEKINSLFKHSEAKTRYDFHVSERVGNELRHLRDLKLIELNAGCYIKDIIRDSDSGQRLIDLTKYIHVTNLGKNFLATREALQSNKETTKYQEHLKPE